MEDGSPPAKRPKHDFADTFDVIVGTEPSSQRFTMHSNVFSTRSGFFKAARKPEWLTGPAQPVDLHDAEPEVFSRYLNCVYFGPGALQIHADATEDDRDIEDDEKEYEDEKTLRPDAFLCSEKEHARLFKEELRSQSKHVQSMSQSLQIFADLYLFADKLHDMETANLVMDELVRFRDKGRRGFNRETIRHVYNSTLHGHPLRKLMRDDCVYETMSSDYMQVHAGGFHPEYTRDVLVEFLRLKDPNADEKVRNAYQLHRGHGRLTDKCHYHQHNEAHPRCVPEPGKEGETSTK